MEELKVNNLNKKFKDVVALDNISTVFKKGSITCLLGPSGNGKTTFLRCLIGLEKLDSGEIYLDDKVIDPIKDSSNKMGLVFQNYNLFPQYTSVENILLPLSIKDKKENKKLSKEDKKVLKEEREKYALSLLSSMSIEDKASNYPFELSGGQKQRLAIARALSLKPEILLFDEPTSALDPKTTKEVANIVKSLKKDYTTIIVTHDIKFASLVADNIIFLLNGKIHLQGKYEDILNSNDTYFIEFLGNKELEDEI